MAVPRRYDRRSAVAGGDELSRPLRGNSAAPTGTPDRRGLGLRKEQVFGSESLFLAREGSPIDDDFPGLVSDGNEPSREGLHPLAANLARVLLDQATFDVDIYIAGVHAGARWAYPRRSLSRSMSVCAASATDVPGGKIASTPAARNWAKSRSGMTPPTTIMASSTPASPSARFSSGANARCPAASDDTPTI